MRGLARLSLSIAVAALAALPITAGAGEPASATVEELLEDAELFYFQFDLRSARRSLEQAIVALGTQAGPQAWERNKAARLLLGAILLEEEGPDADARAREVIAPLIRVAPDFRPIHNAYPVELLSLFERLSGEIAASGRGSLRVDCEEGCERLLVWVESHRQGAAGQSIPLPAGRYQVLIGEGPERLSPRHEVEIGEGEETLLHVDPAGRILGEAALAERLPAATQGTAALAAEAAEELSDEEDDEEEDDEEGEGGADAAALRFRRDREAEERQAREERSLGADAELSRLLQDGREERRAEWRRPAGWVSAGAAVVAATAGIWLHVDASNQDAELRRWARGGGGTAVERASAASRREELQGQSRLGTGLLIGAGAAAATSLFLLLSP